MNILETVLVVTLFLIYLGLWRVKQISQRKRTGIDPKVMASSTSGIQRFMNQFMNLLTVYAAIVVLLHAAGIQFGSLFSRVDAMNTSIFDVVGFVTGLLGLSLCLYAQVKMGSSWRVGIDEKVRTELVTTGLYQYIRNPTYVGLFLLNLGVWLIWPTWTIFLLNFCFVMFLEIQVRCEEDYLLSVHGQEYADYKNRTKRYFPFVY